MKRKYFAAMLLALIALTVGARAHCQIPCGIYDDAARFTLMREHITTIEKSIASVLQLSAAEAADYNQLTRWVMNKEEHADALTEIVTAYFLAQRIKPADPKDAAATEKYQRELAWLHEMIVYSMKVKQSTAIEHCVKLRTLVDMFEGSYLGQTKAAEHSH